MKGQALRAYVGLGSNLAQPREQIRGALEAIGALSSTRVVTQSSLYRSAPMGPADQPDYLNAVVAIDTGLGPRGLLEALQRVERAQGRVRSVRWGPRTIDLDILLYGDRVIDEPGLRVPHPGMPQRAFVLVPLLEIAPDLVLPGAGPLRDLVDPDMRAAVHRVAWTAA
jgi:2-amino-4-hydroxy-6-hydroxymethyldihydropteridine diphosphokinase